MTCHRGPIDGPRLAGPRHDGTHDTCDPCPERHCYLCGNGHLDMSQRQTCTGCIHQTRQRLALVVFLHAELPKQVAYGGTAGHLEAGRPIPGGEAMAMLGPYSLGANDQAARWKHYDLPDDPDLAYEPYDHKATGHQTSLESPNDTPPPLLVLATWEDVFREAFGHGAAQHRATVTNAAAYLDKHLHHVAQWHDAFSDFHRELQRQVGHLEAVLHAGERVEKSDTPCLGCMTKLERQVEQDGSRGDWECPKCKRIYTENGYHNAVTAAWTALQAEVIDGDLWATLARCAAEVGRPKRTIETWVRKGLVARACLISGRRMVVRVADATRQAEERGTRIGTACA